MNRETAESLAATICRRHRTEAERLEAIRQELAGFINPEAREQAAFGIENSQAVIHATETGDAMYIGQYFLRRYEDAKTSLIRELMDDAVFELEAAA